MAFTLKELAERIGAEPVGDPALVIHSAATLEEAGPGQVTFLANPKYIKQLETTRASAVVVVSAAPASDRFALLKAKDPYYAFTQAVIALHGYRKHPYTGIHPKAHVEPTATVGENTILYPGVYIGPGAKVGRDCVLFPNVVVYDGCIIGDRCTIHAGTSIGEDGFGYATHRGEHLKIPQTGIVIVEDDVEIGANCCLDRATLGSTIIGHHTKLSDSVTIGHGTKVGHHCLFVAQTGLAGSISVGHHVTMAGQVGVAGHLTIGDNVTIAAQTGVMNDIPDQSTMLGSPAMPISHARRVYAMFRNLPELHDRIRKLEAQVEELADDPNTDAPKSETSPT